MFEVEREYDATLNLKSIAEVSKHMTITNVLTVKFNLIYCDIAIA